MTIKRSFAVLAGAFGWKKPDTKTQAGPRSTQGTSNNYLSVNTIDPSRLASAFQQADAGYITDQAQLFNLIEEQDPHIFSEMSKRRRSVTGLGWQLRLPDDASQAEIDRAKELTDMLRGIPNFEGFQYDLTDGIGKALAAHEIDWQTGSTWVPRQLVWVPQTEFQIEPKTGALQFVKLGMPEALRPGGWVIHQHKGKSGYIEQAALFRVLAWTYAYKAYNSRDMQRFLELYGLPLRLGKYPAGIDKKSRDELLRAVRSIGNDGAGVVPANMTIDFVQAASGKVSDFLDAVAYWEKKQSMAILGGTLTSQADNKSNTNALGAIHDKARREIMLSDVEQIEPTMQQQLVEPISRINGMFPPDRTPRFAYDTEETVDQKAMVDVLSVAANIGMEIDLDWAHQAMQIPRAKDGAKILVASAAAAKQAKQTDAGAALTRLVALAREGANTPEAYSARLAALGAVQEQQIIDQVAAILAEEGSFEAALARVEELATTPPAADWVNALAGGMAAANLAGRGEA